MGLLMAVAADGVSAEAAAVGAAVESSVLFLGGLAGGINWTTVPTNIGIFILDTSRRATALAPAAAPGAVLQNYTPINLQ